MSTPHSDINVHQSPPQVEMGQSIPPIAKKSTTKKDQRGINSTIDEDIKLVSAWLNVSLDAVTSTDQNTQHFGREFGLPSTMTRNLTALRIL